jgi:hypothetical protein
MFLNRSYSKIDSENYALVSNREPVILTLTSFIDVRRIQPYVIKIFRMSRHRSFGDQVSSFTAFISILIACSM